MVAGPYHQAFRQLVESRRFLKRLLAGLGEPGEYRVSVNPRDISTALGQGKENLRRLKAEGYAVTFIQDESVPRSGVKVSSTFLKVAGALGAEPPSRNPTQKIQAFHSVKCLTETSKRPFNFRIVHP